MKFVVQTLLTLFFLLFLTSCASRPAQPSPTSSPRLAATRVAPIPITARPTANLFPLISRATLLDTVAALTEIEPYSGWRNSASQGERAAIGYLENQLYELAHLNTLGATMNVQEFKVYLSTELWQSQLELTVDDREIAVPASALRGPRDEIPQALRFDSDGSLNDAAPNPVTVSGPVLIVRSADSLADLDPAAVQDKIIFLDYALIDRTLLGVPEAVAIITELITKEPAGLILVTEFSNEIGRSHGTFIGDVSALNWVTTAHNPPVLYTRLEDLTPAGIETWADLSRIQAARLTWDADVFSPGVSHNLIVRIPGRDPSRAILLTTHVDSANNPGALDDAAGSAALLEVARVIDQAQLQPPTDLYLVWFGSQALGFYGSYNFVAHYQALLDRTVAVLQLDSLGYPLDGIEADYNLVTWSYGRLGNGELTWPTYLSNQAGAQGIQTSPANLYQLESDNTPFAAFDVPNANLIYTNREYMEAVGGFHYAAHSHDPYDTIGLVRERSRELEQMVRLALLAALDTGRDNPHLQVTPASRHRALFVASQTEVVHMTPPAFTDLGMTLAMAGYDVDMIPYGQPLTAADLAGVELVIALPVIDYPSQQGDPNRYDTAWSLQQVNLLEAYVEQGGMLVLTNSAHRLKYGNWVEDLNEDWVDVNALATRFGVTYYGRALLGNRARVTSDHDPVKGVSVLNLAKDNALAFYLDPAYSGRTTILAQVGQDPAIALVEPDSGGQVLVLADVGLLNADWNTYPINLHFWEQLARYAAKY